MFHNTATSTSGLSRNLTLLFAAGAGIAVANLYYMQPLLIIMGHTFHASARHMGVVVTLTQIGYAVGLLVIVPLGDVFPRKMMLITLSLLTSLSLAGEALSRSLTELIIFSFFIGFFTVVPQLIIPLVADLSNPDRRGQAIGTAMGGLLVGVLLARTISGAVGAVLGWPAMYLIAAVLMVLLSLLFAYSLPNFSKKTDASLKGLLYSLYSLVLKYKVLRHSSSIGGMMFGAFSALWTVLAYRLNSSPYHYNSAVIGLFGLVGAAGVLAAPITGRITDRKGPRFMIGIGTAIALLAYLILFAYSDNIYLLLASILVMDFASQATQISNQARIYALDPLVRNRINSVYMVSYFLGGAIGSALSSYFYTIQGWQGSMRVAIAFVLIGIIVHNIEHVFAVFAKSWYTASKLMSGLRRR